MRVTAAPLWARPSRSTCEEGGACGWQAAVAARLSVEAGRVYGGEESE